MGRAILCPHCKSTLNEDILKQRNSENFCLVCGGSLLVEEDNGTSSHNEELSFGEDVELGENDSFDEDKIDFWWYSIREPGTLDDRDTGDIYVTCKKCNYLAGSMPYPIDKAGEYYLTGSKCRKKCSHCGNEMKNHILSKRPESWVDSRKRDMWVKDYENIPKCPTCSSIKIRKISVTSKVASVAMWGVLSRKVHKQWHCDTCGSEW